jgi:TonB-linked SusC/RagA family outer membrane protein
MKTLQGFVLNNVKLLSMMVLTLLLAMGAQAQNRVVTGKVTDEKGQAVANASVTAVGTNVSVATKSDGTFSINVPNTAKYLRITSVEIQAIDVTIGNQTNLNIVAKTSEKALEEIIVVAYGTATKETFTGSANKISAKEIQNRTLTNVATALTGTSAGVTTTSSSGQPGSAPSVRIRGFGSVTAGSDPLYVVDGVPASTALSNLNMDDVESISVLKDAATTSLYGSRAANGVVMINTKRGRKGKSNVSFKVNTSFVSRAIPDYERVSAEQYMPLMWEAYRNSLAYRATSPLTLPAASNQASGLVTGQNGIVDLLAYNAFNLPKAQVMLPNGTLNPAAQLIYKREDLDWFSPITRNGIRNEYSLNFSGGADKTDYFLSAAYTKENGYIQRSDFERANARLNLNTQVNNWLKVGTNLAYTYSRGNFASTDGSNSIVNPFFFAARMGPIYPYYAYDPANAGAYLLDANGKRQYDFGNSTIAGLPARPAGAYGGRHTIAENELSIEYFKRGVLNTRTYAEFKIMDGLKFTTNFAVDVNNRTDWNFQNKIIGDGAPAGRLTKDNNTTTTYTFNQLLNFNKKFGDHNIDVLVGHENYNLNDNGLSGTRQGQIVDGNIELTNFTTTTNLSSYDDNYKIESYFANVRYDFQNKYFVTVGARTDGNSRFEEAVRWGRFWSASAAWVISNEAFMSKVNFVNSLKLRSSYGTTGNDVGIGYYPYQTFYTLGRNNGLTPGIVQSSLGNNDLTWETNKQFDIGLDFDLFDRRISGSVEYFRRESDDLLFNVPLPISSGFTSILRNIGTMYNAGIEIVVDAAIVKKKNFQWNLQVNATQFKNEITKLPQTEIISGTKKLMAGKSIYDYWLRQWYGVDPTDGVALFVANDPTAADVRTNAKGDKVTPNVNNAKFDYSGSAIPDWYGGFTNTFRYKNISLSALVNWQIGGLTYDDTYAAYMHSGTYGASLHQDMLKRWQNPGDITDVPRMDNAQTTIFGATSSRWLTDASFLNLQNITLSFDINSGSIIKKIGIQNARFYISMENVAMLTKRSGMNPAQSFTGVTSIGYIPARTMNVGLNVNF